MLVYNDFRLYWYSDIKIEQAENGHSRRYI